MSDTEADMSPIQFIRVRIFRASQGKFASMIGVGQGTVSRWEDDPDIVTTGNLKRIRAAALERALPWEDSWLFEVPDTFTNALAA